MKFFKAQFVAVRGRRYSIMTESNDPSCSGFFLHVSLSASSIM